MKSYALRVRAGAALPPLSSAMYEHIGYEPHNKTCKGTANRYFSAKKPSEIISDIGRGKEGWMMKMTERTLDERLDGHGG